MIPHLGRFLVRPLVRIAGNSAAIALAAAFTVASPAAAERSGCDPSADATARSDENAPADPATGNGATAASPSAAPTAPPGAVPTTPGGPAPAASASGDAIRHAADEIDAVLLGLSRGAKAAAPHLREAALHAGAIADAAEPALLGLTQALLAVASASGPHLEDLADSLEEAARSAGQATREEIERQKP